MRVRRRGKPPVELPEDDGMVLDGSVTPEWLHDECAAQMYLFDRRTPAEQERLQKADVKEYLEPPLW